VKARSHETTGKIKILMLGALIPAGLWVTAMLMIGLRKLPPSSNSETAFRASKEFEFRALRRGDSLHRKLLKDRARLPSGLQRVSRRRYRLRW
jgi:hypothetical protein